MLLPITVTLDDVTTVIGYRIRAKRGQPAGTTTTTTLTEALVTSGMLAVDGACDWSKLLIWKHLTEL
jgi:hypothetical protein